jgi:hypothetical protein
MQGGDNLLKSFNPFDKATQKQQVRTVATFIGLVVVSFKLITVFQAIARKDDGDELNHDDALDLGTSTNYAVLFNSDVSFIKLTVPFGMTQTEMPPWIGPP